MVLQNLCFLALFKAYDGRTLCFSRQSFPRLRELQISGAPHLKQVEIEEDALGSLVTLTFSDCPEMKRLPHGIEYLRALGDICLENTVDELIEMLRQEHETTECKQELMKIGHIRKVIIVSTEKNFWRRIISRKKGMNELCEGLYASCYPQSRRTRYVFMQLLFCWLGGNTLSLLNVWLVSFSSGCCCLCCAALVVQFSTQ